MLCLGCHCQGMEDKQYVEQKTVTWLAAGFIKGVGVQLLLCATETLVWILIGSPTGTRCIDCCVFSLWLPLSGCLCAVLCVHLCGYCEPLQALMMFAEWKASCEAFPNHMLIKMPSLQWHRPLTFWTLPLVFFDYLYYMTCEHQVLPLEWTSSAKTPVIYLFASDLKCHTNVN